MDYLYEKLTDLIVAEGIYKEHIVEVFFEDIEAVFTPLLLRYQSVDDLHLMFKIWLHYGSKIWDASERQNFIAQRASIILQFPDFEAQEQPKIPWGGIQPTPPKTKKLMQGAKIVNLTDWKKS